ncbi:MAG: SDR family NAD(P)-dependent oxidoreductase [Planctomycetota bacterium]
MSEVAVVTGASRGIGLETARELERRGMQVIPVRRKEADLSRMSEVRRLAAELPRPVSVLVNNAGVFESERVVTDEGLELTFAVNQMAPFLLTRELQPERVVNVGSEAHRQARFDLQDLQCENGYRGKIAYANSKLAMVLFTRELVRRGTPAAVLHPGVVDTGLLEAYREDLPWFFRLALKLMPVTTPARAAVGVADLACRPELDGSYYTGGHVREPAEAAQSDATALVWWEALSAIAARA